MKKAGKFLIVLLLIAAIAGGALVYAYYYTDLFKSNKEMFFTYIMQNGDVVSLFNEPGIVQISEKQTSQKQTISSKVDIEYPADEMIDDLNIVLNGKADVPSNKYDYEINLNYNETVGMPYRVAFDGNTLAVTSKDVISQFIGIRNENLKDLASKFGMDTTSIPDKIEFEMPDYTKYSFTENDKSVVNYNELITNSFMEESFTKAKTEDGNTVYTLTTSTNAARDLVVALLEAMKGENLIINKCIEILNDVSQSEEKVTSQDILDSIDKMITDIKETEIKAKEIKVNVYVANKDLVKTEVVAEGLNLILVANENKFEYDVQVNTEEDNARVVFSMDKTRTDDNLKYVVASKFYNEDIEVLNLNIDYAINGIDTQNKVIIDTNLSGKLVDITSEEYENYSNILSSLEFAKYYDEDSTYSSFQPTVNYTEADLEAAKEKLKALPMLSAGMKISTTTDFISEVVFEELNNTNLIALNDYEYNVLVSVFGQVATQFTTVHGNKLKEAGLETDPYLAIPTLIIGTGMYMYNSSSSTINPYTDSTYAYPAEDYTNTYTDISNDITYNTFDTNTISY